MIMKWIKTLSQLLSGRVSNSIIDLYKRVRILEGRVKELIEMTANEQKIINAAQLLVGLVSTFQLIFDAQQAKIATLTAQAADAQAHQPEDLTDEFSQFDNAMQGLSNLAGSLTPAASVTPVPVDVAVDPLPAPPAGDPMTPAPPGSSIPPVETQVPTEPVPVDPEPVFVPDAEPATPAPIVEAPVVEAPAPPAEVPVDATPVADPVVETPASPVADPVNNNDDDDWTPDPPVAPVVEDPAPPITGDDSGPVPPPVDGQPNG